MLRRDHDGLPARAIRIAICAFFRTTAGNDAGTVYSTVKVGRDFVVLAEDRGQYLEGMEVQIARYVEKPSIHLETVISEKTNAHGEVAFKQIKKGTYFVNVAHAGIQEVGAKISVVSGPEGAKIAVEWPGRDILKVQRVAGMFNARFFRDTAKGMVLDIAYKQEGPYAHQPLSLLPAYSNQPELTTTTDDRGKFEFNWSGIRE